MLLMRLFYYSYRAPPFVVFCSVGQGSATYIRLKNNIDILIDAGHDGKTGECLHTYMPLTDKTIDYVFITHPQYDHIGGLNLLVRRYELGNVFQYCSQKKNCAYVPKGKQILFSNNSGSYRINNETIIDYYIPGYGSFSNDLNNESVIYLLKTYKDSILLPGDSPINHLRKVVFERSEWLHNIAILLVPHHGSRTSVSIPFYRIVNPKLAVISVGKNNSYGHPSTYLLDTLKKFHIPYKRTDEDGDIVIDLKK